VLSSGTTPLPPAGMRHCNIVLTHARAEIVEGILSANIGAFAVGDTSALSFFFLDFGDCL
jgi:hypothetical protein